MTSTSGYISSDAFRSTKEISQSVIVWSWMGFRATRHEICAARIFGQMLLLQMLRTLQIRSNRVWTCPGIIPVLRRLALSACQSVHREQELRNCCWTWNRFFFFLSGIQMHFSQCEMCCWGGNRLWSPQGMGVDEGRLFCWFR